MGDGDSVSAIQKAAGRKLSISGGFLCLARQGEVQSRVQQQSNTLWEVTASTLSPGHLGK